MFARARSAAASLSPSLRAIFLFEPYSKGATEPLTKEFVSGSEETKGWGAL